MKVFYTIPEESQKIQNGITHRVAIKTSYEMGENNNYILRTAPLTVNPQPIIG